MKGVSEVIAIILILMITIAIAGLAYTFMSSTMSSTTSAASSSIDSTTSSMLASFTIENMDIAKAYLRNTGQSSLSNLSVYVNDEPVIFNITPMTITPGQVGTVTIYSFIPEGAIVKVTSSNGFSVSKVASPCSKAVGCWKLDEVSGAVAYDQSSYANTGTLTNGPVWTSGKYNNALLFDGINDHISIEDSNSLEPDDTTISLWVNPRRLDTLSALLTKRPTSSLGYMIFYYSTSQTINWDWGSSSASRWNTGYNPPLNEWTNLVFVRNSSGRYLYVNGVLYSSTDNSGNSLQVPSASGLRIGSDSSLGQYYFNGTIDEVRIYDRAIY